MDLHTAPLDTGAHVDTVETAPGHQTLHPQAPLEPQFLDDAPDLSTWPTLTQEASRQTLEEFSKSVNVPNKVHKAVIALNVGGRILQEWVAARQAGYKMMRNFLGVAQQCDADATKEADSHTIDPDVSVKPDVAEPTSKSPLPGEDTAIDPETLKETCTELKPDADWQINRTVCSQKMWEMDKQIKEMQSSLEDAIADAEKGAAAATARNTRGVNSSQRVAPTLQLLDGSMSEYVIATSGFAPLISDLRCSRLARTNNGWPVRTGNARERQFL
jgi:hypothetical protein